MAALASPPVCTRLHSLRKVWRSISGVSVAVVVLVSAAAGSEERSSGDEWRMDHRKRCSCRIAGTPVTPCEKDDTGVAERQMAMVAAAAAATAIEAENAMVLAIVMC
mmetsp:Transcript_22377/g.52794  ORF Transcript_22377/g.52794 Transcript_22377/m.52794 type:complete len:107 (-) Transcript_22377:7-327(-)